MLRYIKNQHIKPFLLGGAVDLATSGVPTFIHGSDDMNALTDIATGRVGMSMRTGFNRQFLEFFTRVNGASNPTAHGIAGYLDLTNSSCEARIRDNAGAVEDRDYNYLFCGWRSSNVDKTLLQQVLGTRHNQRLICAQVNSTGAIGLGGPTISVTKTSTGVYAVTFTRAFARQRPIVMVSPYSSGVASTTLIVSATTSASSITVNMFNAATGAAQDTSFMLIALGQDTNTLQGRQNDPITINFRKPRMLGFRITGSATPALAIGGVDGTVADAGAGTGDYLITFTNPFKQIPVCISTGLDPARAQIHTATTTSVRVITSNAATTLTDSDCNVLVIGSDDASEYR